MPNYKIETVKPASGDRETMYFIASCCLVVLLAAVMLWTNHTKHQNKQSSIPNHLTNFAVQMSNAIEEIKIIQELGVLESNPQPSDLSLPSLEGAEFVPQGEHCFTLHHEGFLFMVEKHESSGWLGAWALSNTNQDCHAALDWHDINL